MGLRPNTLSCRALLLLVQYSHLWLYKGSLLYYIIHIIQYTDFQSLTILLHAHEFGKQFRVVVVDSRPKLEGQLLLRRLVGKGLSCTYANINAISYIMHEVTKVFMGASSVLSNGTVYLRVGTAWVAMVAQEFRVPVLVCCGAYKFHEKVQLDSVCSNELGMHLYSFRNCKCFQFMIALVYLCVCFISCRWSRCHFKSSW